MIIYLEKRCQNTNKCKIADRHWVCLEPRCSKTTLKNIILDHYTKEKLSDKNHRQLFRGITDNSLLIRKQPYSIQNMNDKK